MPLITRQNPETDRLEVLYNGEWVPFDEYRKQQINEAYQNSIKFLRDRLGEEESTETDQETNQNKD
jgi:hypothetical protein